VADHGLTGVLLVGGASTRFGSPKALARLDGETLAERAWRVLGDLCDERIAVGKRGELELPFDVVDDGAAVRAPIAGVVAGLRAASYDIAVMLPVDLPLITSDALRSLAGACRDAAVPQTGPLPGAYRRSALPALERALAEGRLALHAVLDELEVVTVPLDAAVLSNVNTPDDLQRL
jgi:molybdenum cofactor guanylyltransferase